MASFTTTLFEEIEAVTPRPTGISEAAVNATGAVDSVDLPSEAQAFSPPSRSRISIGNRQKKKLGLRRAPGFSDDFFEDVYVLPASIDTGIILSVLTFDVEVYSSYRSDSVTWTGYDDESAGNGVSLASPSPPPPNIELRPQSGSQHILTVDEVGPARIDGSLDFTFSTPVGIVFRNTLIEGTRSVVWPFQPEAPLIERLETNTSILTGTGGQEQRIALREVPRTILIEDFQLEGQERRRAQNLIFDGQARPYGVPVWFETMNVTSPVSPGDTIIEVDSTAGTRLAAGSLVVFWESSERFETLQISAVSTNTITTASPATLAFSAGVLAIPVVTATATSDLQSRRFRVSLERLQVEFTVIDNGQSVASVAAFNSFALPGGETRVLLDDDNFVVSGSVIPERWSREGEVIDNDTSFPVFFTEQSVSRQTSRKGFYVRNRTELFNLRRLLQALAGQRTSFFIPTFSEDFAPTDGVGASDQSIRVEDVGYVDQVFGRAPRNLIRVVKTDGTVSDPKVITGSSKPQDGVELLSISPDSWGVDATLEEIRRVEYVQRARFSTDRIELRHEDSFGKASVSIPTITVLEGD